MLNVVQVLTTNSIPLIFIPFLALAPMMYIPSIGLVPKLDEIELISHQAAAAAAIIKQEQPQFDPKTLLTPSLLPAQTTSMALSLMARHNIATVATGGGSLAIESHEDTKERRFACEKCSRRYVRKISLQRHQKYECGKEQHLVCPVTGCQYKTFYHCSLKKHMLIHTNR